MFPLIPLQRRVARLVFVLVLSASIAQGGPATRYRGDPSEEAPPAMVASFPDRFVVQFIDAPVLEKRDLGAREAERAADVSLTRRRQLLNDLSQRREQSVSTKASQRAAADVDTYFDRVYQFAFNGVALPLSPDEVVFIRSLDYVKDVHPDTPVHADLAQSVQQIGADRVWRDVGVTGSGVVVAVIDTGVDYTHPDLGGGFGPGNKVIGGYDFCNEDADPMDDNGHGTHVSGIVAANGVLTGVAPDAQLLAYKVLRASGGGTSSDLLAGIDRACDPDGNPGTDDAADVINLSLSKSYGSGSDYISDAVNVAVAYGAVCVASAGNRGPGYETITSPGGARDAITVGSVDAADQLAASSSRGPETSLRLAKPDICAPGVSIASCGLGGATWSLSGTSMAAPHVAGGAALLLEAHPDFTPAEVKSALLSSAHDLGLDPVSQGMGRLDVYAATQCDILIDPSPLQFGVIYGSDVDTTEAITLRNVAAVTRNIDLTVVPGYLPEDVTVTISPSRLSLVAGSSATVELRIVAPAEVVGPLGEPYLYTGTIRAQYETGVSRAMFTFCKQIPDSMEPNNSWSEAHPIEVTQRHTLVQETGPTRIDHNEPGASYPDYDWYRFEGEAGRQFFAKAQVDRSQGTFEVSLELYDASRRTLVSDPNGYAQIDFFTLPSDGTYYLSVRRYAGKLTGGYCLTVNYLPDEVIYSEPQIDPDSAMWPNQVEHVDFCSSGGSLLTGANRYTTSLYDTASPVGLAWRVDQTAICQFLDGASDDPLIASVATPGFLDHTWVYDGVDWVLKAPATSPPGLYKPSMVFDEARGEVVLFGGMDHAGQYQNKTWVWDGVTWTRKTPVHSPPAQFNSVMAYDRLRQTVVLCNSELPVSPGTWIWNGSDWSENQSAVQPYVGQGDMAYDPRDQTLLLVATGSSGSGETWRFDGANWSKLAPTNHPRMGRNSQDELVFDEARNEMVFVCWTPQQTWVWTGSDWERRYPSTTFSVGSQNVVYDSARQKIVHQSHPSWHDDRYQHNQTYEWDGTNWSKIATAHNTPKTTSFAMAYDRVRQQTVYFGGQPITVAENSLVLRRESSATPLFEDRLHYPMTVSGLGVSAQGDRILTSHDDGNVAVRYTSGAVERWIDRVEDITLLSLVETGDVALFEESDDPVVYDLTSDTQRSGLPSGVCLVALSDNAGQAVCVDGLDIVMYDWSGSVYRERWSTPLPELANHETTHLAIAGNARTVMVVCRSAINATHSNQISYHLLSGSDGEILVNYSQTKRPENRYEFYPMKAIVNADGSLAAAITGGIDAPNHSVVVLSPDRPEPAFLGPMPSYVYDVALSDNLLAIGASTRK